MKKQFILWAVVILSLFSTSFAQENEHLNMLRVSPFQFSRATFQLNYERVFNDKKHGIVISPGFILRETNQDSLVGMNASIQYRFYLDRWDNFSAMDDWLTSFAFYAAPFVQGIWLEKREQQYAHYYDNWGNYQSIGIPVQSKVASYSGGLVFGAQLFVTKRLVMDVFLGGGVRLGEREWSYDESLIPAGAEFTVSNYSEMEFDPAYTGVLPKAGFQLGYSF